MKVQTSFDDYPNILNLASLITKGKFAYSERPPACRPHQDTFLANYLDSKGVIWLPCKVGDTVYFLDYNDYKPCLTKGENGGCCPHLYSAYGWNNNCRKTLSGAKPADCVEIKSIEIESVDQIFKLFEHFNKTIYLSLKAAEKARSV